MRWVRQRKKATVARWERLMFGPIPEIVRFGGEDDSGAVRNRRVTRAEFFEIYDTALQIRRQDPIRQVCLANDPDSGRPGFYIWRTSF